MKKTSLEKHEVDHNHPANEYTKYISNSWKEATLFFSICLVIGIILQLCYPYPDFTSDTGGYINLVLNNFIYGGPRSRGYSWLLYYIKEAGGGAGSVFMAQYIIHCLAMYFFYSSIVYLFAITTKPLKAAFFILTIFFVSGIYATKMVLSDSVFTSLTVCLVTCCLWIIYGKSKYLVIPLTLLLFGVILFRFIGLACIVFVIPVIVFGYRQKLFSVAVSCGILLLLLQYIQDVKQKTTEHQGVEVFSAFGGWQHASNALHVIPYIERSVSSIGEADADIMKIDTIVRLTYDYNKRYYPDAHSVTYDFMWNDSLPLRVIFWYHRLKASNQNYYHNWNAISLKFDEYGKLLIKEHPAEFFRYYILNNTKRALHPPVEIFSSFADSVSWSVISDWFQWQPSQDITPEWDILRPVLKNTSWFYTGYWLAFAFSISYIIFQLATKKMSVYSTSFALIACLVGFVLVYTIASIYAAPVNLRFLLPVRVTILGLAFALIQRIVASLKNKEETTIV